MEKGEGRREKEDGYLMLDAGSWRWRMEDGGWVLEA